jgi:uncharacterized membrane protein
MSNHLIYAKHPKAPKWSDWYVLWPVWALCAGLLLMVAFALVWEYVAYLPPRSDIPEVALSHGRDLHLDPSKLIPQQLRLFEVRSWEQKVKFLVERTQDKTVHAALASCHTCYRSHDRHYAEHGQMICGECNGPMAFESKDRRPGANSCVLVEIPHTETDRDITVLARDVLSEAAKQSR